MYDPEEACNDAENSNVIVVKDESKVKDEAEEEQDEKWADIDSTLKQEKTEVEAEEVEVKPNVASPRTRRVAQVKNGAGPKSKRGRKQVFSGF